LSEIVFVCPYCGDKESHGHLHVNSEKAVFHCFLCNEGGPVKKLIKDHPSMAIELSVLGAVFPKQESHRKPKTFFSVFEKSVMGVKALAYLSGRGMRLDEIRRCGCLLSPDLPYYVIFPHEGGVEYFWAARAIAPRMRPKWLFPANGETRGSKSSVLWGMMRQRRNGEIWLCEGVFDALAVDGVASYGKAVSARQLATVLAYNPTRVVVAFDRDAREEAEKLQVKLRGIVLTSVIPPEKPYKDYGEKLAIGWRRSK